MRLKPRDMILSALFASLTAVGAYIKFPLPLYPVAFSLQMLFVFLAGVCLPPFAAFLSQAVYVLVGLLGVPVFTGASGFAAFLSPTFGYLIAFLIMAPVTSVLTRKYWFQNKPLPFLLLSVLLTVGAELLGVAYTGVLNLAMGTPLPFSSLFYLFYIFLPVDLFKLALSVAFGSLLKRRAPNLF